MTTAEMIEYQLHLAGYMSLDQLFRALSHQEHRTIMKTLDAMVEEKLVLLDANKMPIKYRINMEKYVEFTNALGGKRVRRLPEGFQLHDFGVRGNATMQVIEHSVDVKYTHAHNPDYKLIRKWVSTVDGYKHVIYGETNEGGNPGLEVYYHRDNAQGHHHHSRRWPVDKVPAMYKNDVEELRKFIKHCPKGHKLYSN